MLCLPTSLWAKGGGELMDWTRREMKCWMNSSVTDVAIQMTNDNDLG